MKLILLTAAFGLTACVSFIPIGYQPYSAPPTPTTYWIWPALVDAELHATETEARLCITQVPDGFATEGC